MSSGGKGHDRRPQGVDDKTFADNWDRIFKGGSFGVKADSANNDLLGRSSTVEQESLKFSDVRSNRTAPATIEESHENASKPTHESLACSAAPSCSQGQNSQVQGEGQSLIYVDDATGKEVDESWWPGDPHVSKDSMRFGKMQSKIRTGMRNG